ncbi:MAG TPA: helix-turn-helix domain-containing protein, partial [Acidimicrobiales bacterium]
MADVARAGGEDRGDARHARLSRKGVQTRARLVEAAKRVFERDGFLEARIVDIAEAANLAPGSFYHYFDSKEELFLEVAKMQEERLTAPSSDSSAGSGDSSPTES